MNKITKSKIKQLLLLLRPKHKQGYRFAGSCDLIVINRKEKKIELIDWKTKSDFNPIIEFKIIYV